MGENRKYYAFDQISLKADVSDVWNLNDTWLNPSLKNSVFP